MSMIVVGIAVAAAAGVGGLVALRVVRRRRAEPPPLPAPRADPEPGPRLAAGVGDVIQHGDTTRWPQHGLLVRSGEEIRGAILLSAEQGTEQATVALAPPERHLLWLEASEVALPPRPPARLEIQGYLLDRAMSFPASLEPLGEPPEPPDTSATFALYEGRAGDAAVVLVGKRARVWYGRRLSPGDFDNLGRVDT